MKIRKIWIKGYHQFKDTFIDLTNPITGEALDKVCFIGKNGTGKSTLLKFIKDFINESGQGIYSFLVEFNYDHRNVIYFRKYINNPPFNIVEEYFLDPEIITLPDWREYLMNTDPNIIRQEFKDSILEPVNNQNVYQISKFFGSNSLLVYSPSEALKNSYLDIDDCPVSNVNTALGLFNNFPFYNEVSMEHINEFWTVLIYLIKQRQEEKEKFETKEENINKTKKDLIAEFDVKYPIILDKLAVVWDKILANAGLEFNVEGATSPIQLTDNLWAYVRTIETKVDLDYNQLSTGIRNFIFRIGHIFSLYFNREIKRGIVLIDEPENSLFPDFLYDLIETYQNVFIDKNGENNTQFFVATHSPIIAAQFEPYERIILEWDEPGSVKAFKGKAPAGDDPNDILQKDFSISHLMGKRGEEMWKEYLNMKKRLRHTSNENEKMELTEKIAHLGNEYNF